jgi:hypothetical protein
MSLVGRARVLQYRLEHRIHLLPVLSMKSYFQFLFLVFFIVGVMLFLWLLLVPVSYDGITQVNVFAKLKWYDDPLFYFGLGLVCFVMFLYARFSKK